MKRIFDRADILLSGMFGERYSKYYGCIEVGSNVFIGSDSVILPDVKIGDNTIIGAGAVVSRDLPPGYVWGGVPARQLGTFQNFIDRRKAEPHPESSPDKLWEIFDSSRKQIDEHQAADPL